LYREFILSVGNTAEVFMYFLSAYGHILSGSVYWSFHGTLVYSLMYDPFANRVYDYIGGMEDLKMAEVSKHCCSFHKA
jgi:hypothetical protein